MVSIKWTVCALVSLNLGSMACEQKQPAPAASASAAIASAAPSAKPPDKPWFVGTWQAELDVEPYQIEQTKQEGKIKAWAEGPSDKAVGKGQLELQIDEAGAVTGKVEGPLGELAASGTLDGETLRVRFQPLKVTEPPEMFTGVLLAQKSNGGFSGDLKASSGDSLTVRKSAVKLAKSDAKAGAEGASKGK